MPPRVAAFAAKLPYWTTLSVALRQPVDLPAGRVPVLVLKDGTLVVGLRCRGLDIYAAGNASLNRHAEILNKALCQLPAQAYLQTSFETGLRFDGLIDRFAQKSQPTSHPLLQWGRAQRAQGLRRNAYLTRCQITYWLGWRGALEAATPGGPGPLARAARFLGLGGGCTPEALRTAVEVLYAAAAKFTETAAQMGMQLSFLDEDAILADCFRAINPSMHARLPAPTYAETAEDHQAYREGAAKVLRQASLSSQLARGPLKGSSGHLVVGEPPVLLRALGISGLPNLTRPTALHAVMYACMPKRPFRLVITHQALDKKTSLRDLQQKRRFTTGLLGRQLANHEARHAFANMEGLIEAVADKARVFDTHMVALACGHDAAELQQATQDVCEGFETENFSCATLLDEQLKGWRGSLPGYGYMAPKTATLTGHNGAHLLPYWLPSQGEPEPELIFETRQRSLECMTVRPGKQRDHAGAIIVGALGSGKTFLNTHFMKYGCLDFGGHVVLVDNKGPKNSSYRAVCKLLEGAYIALEDNEEVSFNPVPTRQEVYGCQNVYNAHVVQPLEQILCMMAVPDLASRDDRNSWRMVARDVVKLTYEAAPSGDAPLTLSDVLAAFGHYEPDLESIRVLAPLMRERLFIWLQDPRRDRLFNRPAHADMSNPFTVFDFFGMDKDAEAAAVLVAVLASRIEAKLTTLPMHVPKLFAFDEAWQMFNTPTACQLLNRLYRITRSYNAYCCLMTQSYADIEKSPACDGILTNTTLICLMAHLHGHAETAALLKLTPRQLELFASLEIHPNAYAEFLLVDRHEKRTHVLQYWASSFDLWCDTSRPADVHLRNQWLQQLNLPLAEVVHRLAQRYPHGAPQEAEAAAPTASQAGAA